jgi:hypothetical protein
VQGKASANSLGPTSVHGGAGDVAPVSAHRHGRRNFGDVRAPCLGIILKISIGREKPAGWHEAQREGHETHGRCW